MALELCFVGEVPAYDPKDDSQITTTSTVTLEQNIERDVCYWKVPRGVKFRIPTFITKLQMKLKDNAGNDLHELTQFSLAIKSPLSKETPTKIVSLYYRPWKELTLKEQLDDDYADRVSVRMNVGATFIELPEDWELHFLIKLPKTVGSSVTFHFGNSTFVLPIEEVRA